MLRESPRNAGHKCNSLQKELTRVSKEVQLLSTQNDAQAELLVKILLLLAKLGDGTNALKWRLECYQTPEQQVEQHRGLRSSLTQLKVSQDELKEEQSEQLRNLRYDVEQLKGSYNGSTEVQHLQTSLDALQLSHDDLKRRMIVAEEEASKARELRSNLMELRESYDALKKKMDDSDGLAERVERLEKEKIQTIPRVSAKDASELGRLDGPEGSSGDFIPGSLSRLETNQHEMEKRLDVVAARVQRLEDSSPSTSDQSDPITRLADRKPGSGLRGVFQSSLRKATLGQGEMKDRLDSLEATAERVQDIQTSLKQLDDGQRELKGMVEALDARLNHASNLDNRGRGLDKRSSDIQPRDDQIQTQDQRRQSQERPREQMQTKDLHAVWSTLDHLASGLTQRADEYGTLKSEVTQLRKDRGGLALASRALTNWTRFKRSTSDGAVSSAASSSKGPG